MSLLDTIIGAAGTLLKDNTDMQQKLTDMAAELLKEVGGLSGLIAKFQSNGLGDIISSWMGGGEKTPVSGEQLHQVLGTDLMTGLADKAGIDSSLFDTLLSKGLPSLVSHLTADGKTPEQIESIDLNTAKDWIGKLFS